MQHLVSFINVSSGVDSDTDDNEDAYPQDGNSGCWQDSVRH